MDALDLLSGDARAFREKVWASRVHLHETDPAELVGLLELDDVDRLLTSSALRTPALRVVRDGDDLTLSGRFATELRPPGADAQPTGRSYDVVVTVAAAGEEPDCAAESFDRRSSFSLVSRASSASTSSRN